MINTLFFVLCLVTTCTSHKVDGILSTLKEDLQLERHLKVINKSPIKSIHTKFGYIVDCIDINKQPAFDHPLLKNHTLQRKPSFQKKFGKTSVKISPTEPIFGLEKDQCPRGTVPIRRTTKDDLVRAKSYLNNHILEQGINRLHVAEVTLAPSPSISYRGVSGTNSVYNPRVEKDQSSTAIMWVRNGAIDDTNLIAVGWHVAPQLYNDDRTHVYIRWTTNNFKTTGCYNLQCPGFVQTNKEIVLGGDFVNTSVYGESTTECSFSIAQDQETKNWWISIANKNIGYFPASLFPNMISADHVGWGGRTTTSMGTPSPPMGSGHLPDNNLLHASYFRQVSFQDDSGKVQGPEKNMVQTFTDVPNCFGAEYYGDEEGEIGYFLQFGGPGGNCGD